MTVGRFWLTFQAGLKWDMHVRDISMMARRLVYALARLGGKGWGYHSFQYGLLYKTLFQSVCAYAVHGWARNLTARNKKHLLSAQRQALIRTTKAYATSSTI